MQMTLKIFISFIGIVFLYPVNTHAQFNVNGKLTDTAGGSIRYARLSLRLQSDSLSSVYTVSDSTGEFRFQNIPGGKYWVDAAAVNFLSDSIFVNLQADTTLSLRLKTKVKVLSDFVVKSVAMPRFERKSDRFVYNIANSPLITGNTVWEVLKQTPMVQASAQGSLSVLGNPQSATVYINRRRFPLSGDDLYRFLREMPSDNLLRIEVLTIPPPFYDATGPVIDIILKKLEINGTRGSLTGGYTRSKVNVANGALSLDFNRNNYNQSFMIGGTGGKEYQDISRETAFKNTAGSVLSSNLESYTDKKSLNLFTDIRCSINPVLTTGTQWVVLLSERDLKGNGMEYDKINSIANYYGQNISTDNKLINGNVFLKYYSGRKNEYFEINSDYLFNRLQQTTDFIQARPQPSLKTDVPQTIKNYSAKADYSRRIFRKISMEAGLRWSSSNVITPYEVFENSSGSWSKVERLSALFDYREEIKSVYVTFEKELSPKWSAKVGLKVEDTHINTFTSSGLSAEGIKNKNSFIFLFPVGYLNFNPNSNHSLSLTSRTNNSRPEYYALNPARILLGPRTITEGNPYLNPSNGGILEFMYSYKQTYYTGITYSVARRLYTQINSVINPDTLLIRWGNWGDIAQFNFWTFTQRDIIKNKWSVSFNSNIGLYDRKFNRDSARIAGSQDNWQLYLTVNNNFSNIISPNLRLYCNFNYNTPGRFGYWRDNRSTWRIDAGGSCSVPKTGVRIGLSVNDILKFADKNLYLVNATTNQATSVLSNNDRRGIRIWISKSFGNLKAKKLDQRETSNEEEKQRVN
jgi:hypothetical protein